MARGSGDVCACAGGWGGCSVVGPRAVFERGPPASPPEQVRSSPHFFQSYHQSACMSQLANFQLEFGDKKRSGSV